LCFARDYRNRRIGDFLKELKLTEGKATGFPLMKDEMAKNGNPEPLFFTDEERTLFLVTLPCHSDWLVSKAGTKSVLMLSREYVNQILSESIDIQYLSNLLDNDISEVRDYVRELIGTKSGTKLLTIIDLLGTIAKSRVELLEGIGLYNKTGNFNNYIKPLIKSGIIELTIPDKPNSQNQKYRLTEKGRKLLK